MIIKVAFSIFKNFIKQIDLLGAEHGMAEGENVEESVMVFEFFIAFYVYFLNVFVGEGHSLQYFEFLVQINSV